MKAKIFHQLAYEQKKPYLEFIAGLAHSGLADIFRFPNQDLSFWWFSLIAEKSPAKTNAYQDLISLLSGNMSAGKPGLRTRISGCWPAVFLKGWLAYFIFVLRFFYIKLSFSGFGKRASGLKNRKYVLVSSFPFFDKAKARSGIFENAYFSSLNRIMDKNHPEDYAQICLQFDYGENNLFRDVHQARTFLKKSHLFFLEEFIRFGDLLWIAYYYLYFAAVGLINIKKVKTKFIYTYQENNINVWDIYKRDYNLSFNGIVSITSLEFIVMFRRLVSYLNKETKVIAAAEMHEWEKALYYACKKTGIISIAYQHAHLPELLLNYFNHSEELGEDGFIQYCPLPDYLATVGTASEQLLLNCGWSRDRVFVWGAQRFEQLRLLRQTKKSDFKNNYFICAFSVLSSEVEQFLKLLAKAFPDYPGYKILLKSHALLDIRSIVNTFDLTLNKETFEFTTKNMEELITESQGMIVTGSSSCFYALACGVQIIIPIFSGRLDLNPLSYSTDIPFYVYSHGELRSICDSIINKTARLSAEEKLKCTLNNYLYFPEDEIEYFNKLGDCVK